METPIIGNREFVGGLIHPVYLDMRGRQYVLGEDGEWVYGLWLYEGEDDAPDVIFLDAPHGRLA
jgi:hypothetical protein